MRTAAAPVAADLQDLQQGISLLARQRLREYMIGLVLDPSELEECWRLLKAHASPPLSPLDERINYDDFCQVADAMPARAAETFFGASHFLKFPLDRFGRISIVHLFQWARCKNALLRTRVELSCYDSSGNGQLTERELEQWVTDLIPRLPALTELRKEFFPYYKVTAVRKFLFFLDPKRRGRVSLQDMLSSPILHELLDLRRADLPAAELKLNWFSLDYAEMLYSDYLKLDSDQNGMLSVNELAHYKGGGLTMPFVQRVFQECHTYRNKEWGHNEMDYKSYLDFVLAMSYKATPEAIGYFFRLLDLERRGRLSAFEVSYFFRAVVDKFEEIGEEPNCTVEDVQDEIFDMIKPRDPMYITLHDLVNCKVGDTIIGMLTDVHDFFRYDRREQFMGHENEGES